VGIRADLAAGDRPAATRRHGRFKERLKEQLGLEPSPETNALLRECAHPVAAVS
jgi:DNA-binding SARP family transcriptional activator